MRHKLGLSSALSFLIAVALFAPQSGGKDSGSVSAARATATGPYKVQLLLEREGMRNGPDYDGATVYYPAGGEPPFASVVIVPGYESGEDSIQAWGPFYASYGIVAMTIGTNSGADDPAARALALLDAVKTLRHEHDRVESPLYGQLDLERVAVSGWSMGGGGAQLAAVLLPSLEAVVALCPWLGAKGQADLQLEHPVPLLIISGEWDDVAPPAVHANAHYEATPASTDKLLFEVARGGHYVAYGPNGASKSGASLSSGDVGQVALAWLMVYLMGDLEYRSLLLDVPEVASQYITNLEE